MKISVTSSEYEKIKNDNKIRFKNSVNDFKIVAKRRISESDYLRIEGFLDAEEYQIAFLDWNKLIINIDLNLTEDEERIVNFWYSFFSK